MNVPISDDETKYSPGYRNLFRRRVLTRLHKFKPDFIFISAGFDSHENEEINGGYVKLTEFDYDWMTRELVKIAKKYSKGRMVSVLEGGYNIKTGVISSFAQSVMYHVKAMVLENQCSLPANGDYDDIIYENTSSTFVLKVNDNTSMLKKKRRREYENDMQNFNYSKELKTKKFGYHYNLPKNEEIKSKLRVRSHIDYNLLNKLIQDEIENKNADIENVQFEKKTKVDNANQSNINVGDNNVSQKLEFTSKMKFENDEANNNFEEIEIIGDEI